MAPQARFPEAVGGNVGLYGQCVCVWQESTQLRILVQEIWGPLRPGKRIPRDRESARVEPPDSPTSATSDCKENVPPALQPGGANQAPSADVPQVAPPMHPQSRCDHPYRRTTARPYIHTHAYMQLYIHADVRTMCVLPRWINLVREQDKETEF